MARDNPPPARPDSPPLVLAVSRADVASVDHIAAELARGDVDPSTAAAELLVHIARDLAAIRESAARAENLAGSAAVWLPQLAGRLSALLDAAERSGPLRAILGTTRRR